MLQINMLSTALIALLLSLTPKLQISLKRAIGIAASALSLPVRALL